MALTLLPAMISQSLSLLLGGVARDSPNKSGLPGLKRVNSFSEIGSGEPVEYFVASDASAIIEHTKRIVFLEDDDIAEIKEGRLMIHRKLFEVNTSLPITRYLCLSIFLF